MNVADVAVFKVKENTKKRPEFLHQKANIIHLVFTDYYLDNRSSILTRRSQFRLKVLLGKLTY